MPALQTHRARYSLLTFCQPGEAPLNAGVLLEDSSSNTLHLRLRRDWDEVCPEESDTLEMLPGHLEEISRQMGAKEALAFFHDRLSNAFTATEPRETIVENFSLALARLYREHIESRVKRWSTHVPRYSLTAAAGPFRDNSVIEESGWEEIPPGVRITQEMFAAEVQGGSMEPVIPSGSLCLFRRNTAGSRENKLVLVEALGESNDRYTVKRYRSEKRSSSGEEWSQKRIRLESLNPEYPSWDLDETEDRYRIVAEFVSVLS